MDNRSIGIFDSGLGGIAVLKVAKDVLPNENFIFYGDNKNAPYGLKTAEEIFKLSKNCVDLLIEKGVKAIVIACNTATGVSVKRLREMYNIPFISMEPAVKVGMKNAHGGKVLVLATPATLKQDKYLNLLVKLDAKDEVFEVACDGLASLIEKGIWQGEKIEDYLFKKLAPVKDIPIDSCVLGCTHYAFVRDSIDKVLKTMGKNAAIVDGSEGTARHLQYILAERDMLKGGGSPQKIDIYSSDESKIDLLKKALYL